MSEINAYFLPVSITWRWLFLSTEKFNFQNIISALALFGKVLCPKQYLKMKANLKSTHTYFYAFSFYGCIEHILSLSRNSCIFSSGRPYGNFNINRCGVLIESVGVVLVEARI